VTHTDPWACEAFGGPPCQRCTITICPGQPPDLAHLSPTGTYLPGATVALRVDEGGVLRVRCNGLLTGYQGRAEDKQKPKRGALRIIL
jgi:hypothetical protein